MGLVCGFGQQFRFFFVELNTSHFADPETHT